MRGKLLCQPNARLRDFYRFNTVTSLNHATIYDMRLSKSKHFFTMDYFNQRNF